jgi:ABC-2 type transport system ATP-binding protein
LPTKKENRQLNTKDGIVVIFFVLLRKHLEFCSMIEVENLTKIFGKQRAVDNIQFTVQKGEIVGFLGPNGAGKSTTMKIATGYLPPSAGKVRVCGFDVTTHSKEVRKNIGYLPEHNPLYLDMYVKEYLGFAGELHGLWGKKKRERIAEIIERTGLTREQGKKIGSLSKGYRQRVGLAQAILHNPPVLILDEPTTGLDPNQIVEIRQLIKSLGEEKTIIFSTHIMQEVQALCDRAVIINLGKIVADSPVANLQQLAQSETILRVEFLETIDENILAQIKGVHKVEKMGKNRYLVYTREEQDLRPAIFQLATEKKWTLVALQQEERTLENVFQSLTK